MRHFLWITGLLLSTLSCGDSPPATVVFAGDSLTFYMQNYWQETMPASYRYYIDEGINGNTSTALLARFEADVLSKRAAVVHILIGTNDTFDDVEHGTLPLEVTEQNIVSMVTMARAAGKRVILATVPPTTSTYPDPSTAIAVNARIELLNSWIRSEAAANGLGLADYYPALLNHGFLDPQYCIDGHVHLNRLGYEKIAPLTLQAIARVL